MHNRHSIERAIREEDYALWLIIDAGIQRGRIHLSRAQLFNLYRIARRVSDDIFANPKARVPHGAAGLWGTTPIYVDDMT